MIFQPNIFEISIDLEPVPVRYSDIYKREKAKSEMGGIFRKKNVYPIAPDGTLFREQSH